MRLDRQHERTSGDIIRKLYPESAAGGFTRVDGTVAFYIRVRALLRPDAMVMDFGAGRGASKDDPVPFRRDLRILRGHAACVIGLDIDNTVLANETVDERRVIATDRPFPLPDESVDLVVSDYTFEHISDPAWASRELDRVLRPGGWLCARTPNRWGYIGLSARLVPNSLHVGVLQRLQPLKPSDDTFPTVYRLNSPSQLERWFPNARYEHIVWASDSEPDYVGRSAAACRAMRSLCAVTPPPLRSVLSVFLRKKPR